MRALITNSFKAGVYKIRKGLAAALVAAALYLFSNHVHFFEPRLRSRESKRNHQAL